MFLTKNLPQISWSCVSPIQGERISADLLAFGGLHINSSSFFHSFSRSFIDLTMINCVYFAPGTGLIAGDTDGDWREKWVVARLTAVPKACGPYTLAKDT